MKKPLTNIINSCLLIWLIVLNTSESIAQKTDQLAYDLLEKAMGPIGKEEPLALYFEGLCFGLKSPTGIFSQPVYKVYRGGYMYNDGKKFEVQLGIMKALCDGNIMVVIDEQSKTMVIDSLRASVPGFEDQVPDIEKLITKEIGDAELHYEGKEIVQGKSCHRIRTQYKGHGAAHILYYVEEKSGRMFLISEFQRGVYDCYWIKKIGKAPENYNYAIHIPKKETEKMYGYEVHDFRFISENLKGNKN
jgi:uncharacterized protein YodC (DUF2158 family)